MEQVVRKVGQKVFMSASNWVSSSTHVSTKLLRSNYLRSYALSGLVAFKVSSM